MIYWYPGGLVFCDYGVIGISVPGGNISLPLRSGIGYAEWDVRYRIFGMEVRNAQLAPDPHPAPECTSGSRMRRSGMQIQIWDADPAPDPEP